MIRATLQIQQALCKHNTVNVIMPAVREKQRKYLSANAVVKFLLHVLIGCFLFLLLLHH